jgi:biotin carboxylase
MRIPGMGETTVRHFRDKLAMRQRAHEAGVLVPEFAPVLNHTALREYMERVPGPWVLKPRTEAAAIGIRKVATADEVWHVLEELGDRQSHHLIERYVPGDVFHVDSIVTGHEVRFAEVHRYAVPPFDVVHSGGLFSTRTVARGSAEEAELEQTTQALAKALGLRHGVMHTEFIRSAADGRFHFLETAARVGGAHIVELVEAATGVNLWREWARVEVADARADVYTVPEHREDYAGLLLSLARQEWPDTAAFDDPEVVWRMTKRHHAGVIVRSDDPRRVGELLDAYVPRFYEDFHASLPAPDRPTA